MTQQKRTYDDATLPKPHGDAIPARYEGRLNDLFDTWWAVRARNLKLSMYYNMKNVLKDLGISIPEGMLDVNCMVGWCKKAVDARAVRSIFDGFVFSGEPDAELSRMVKENRLRTLYGQACRSALVHGIAAVTVMRGNAGQPAAKVRAYSANQFSVLWDKDEGRIACGVVCSKVDEDGTAVQYVAHFPEAVLTIDYVRDGAGAWWACSEEPNPMGRPLMEVICHDPDLDRPLGHSLLTRELRGIVDKAMRDVLRMEVGAEFFTYPQRYVLGAADTLFGDPPEGCTEDEEGNYVDADGNVVSPVPNAARKAKAYLGALFAIGRDENGEVPTVGQFSPGSADNFTRVFENDAQRFSGATNVPLAQLGVLSNTYTSSDALGAANDPLILAVEEMNRQNGEVLEEVARMMMAVAGGVPMSGLSQAQRDVQACFKDPSLPTISANADAWTKIGGADKALVGTRVWYEQLGQPQATIDRIESQKQQAGAIETLNRIADGLASGKEPGRAALEAAG